MRMYILYHVLAFLLAQNADKCYSCCYCGCYFFGIPATRHSTVVSAKTEFTSGRFDFGRIAEEDGRICVEVGTNQPEKAKKSREDPAT